MVEIPPWMSILANEKSGFWQIDQSEHYLTKQTPEFQMQPGRITLRLGINWDKDKPIFMVKVLSQWVWLLHFPSLCPLPESTK